MTKLILAGIAGFVCALSVTYVRDWALKLYTIVKALLDQYRGQ